MSSPDSSLITRLAYGASQLPRVAWYLSHGLALRRLSQSETHGRRRAHSDRPIPERGQIYLDMARLLLKDLANVEAGVYPLPADHDGSLLTLIRRSRLFFEDLPRIHKRRRRGAHDEVLTE